MDNKDFEEKVESEKKQSNAKQTFGTLALAFLLAVFTVFVINI